jgi:hypothetical protein
MIFTGVLLVATIYLLVVVAVMKKKRTLIWMLPIITLAIAYTFISYVKEMGYAIPSTLMIDMPGISERITDFEVYQSIQDGDIIYVLAKVKGDTKPRLMSFPYSQDLARGLAQAQAMIEGGEQVEAHVVYDQEGGIGNVVANGHGGGKAPPPKNTD